MRAAGAFLAALALACSADPASVDSRQPDAATETGSGGASAPGEGTGGGVSTGGSVAASGGSTEEPDSGPPEGGTGGATEAGPPPEAGTGGASSGGAGSGGEAAGGSGGVDCDALGWKWCSEACVVQDATNGCRDPECNPCGSDPNGFFDCSRDVPHPGCRLNCRDGYATCGAGREQTCKLVTVAADGMGEECCLQDGRPGRLSLNSGLCFTDQ